MSSLEYFSNRVIDPTPTEATSSEDLLSMSLSAFCNLVCARSGGKLSAYMDSCAWNLHTPPAREFAFHCPSLLPVTHFKALAKVTHYHWSSRKFIYREESNAPEKTRKALLSLADKMARSKKKVSWDDIYARKDARRDAFNKKFQDEIEDYVVGAFGSGEQTPEHVAAAIRGLTQHLQQFSVNTSQRITPLKYARACSI